MIACSSTCTSIRSKFLEYLDGVLSGASMRSVAEHLAECRACGVEFAEESRLHALLADIGPAKPPADLGLRLRVAISQERARTAQRRMDVWQMYWQNTMAPVLARGAAGLVSAVILLGALALMIGTVAVPPTVAANETVAESTSAPRFLYTIGGNDSRAAFPEPVVVQVEVSKTGRAYGYRIVSGPQTEAVRAQLDNFLLMSHFTPALFYGNPVPSEAILSFTGTASTKHRGQAL